MPETATLSAKYQISIPKAVRAAQHWEAGLTFAFIPKGTGVLLVPVPNAMPSRAWRAAPPPTIIVTARTGCDDTRRYICLDRMADWLRHG